MSRRTHPVPRALLGAALVSGVSGCVEITEFDLGPGTTVLSVSGAPSKAYVVSEDHAGLVIPIGARLERVSSFDCSPERLGIALGPHDLDGAPLVPDHELAHVMDDDSLSPAQPRPLPIASPLVVSSERLGFELIEDGPDVGDCSSSSVLVGADSDQLARAVLATPEGATELDLDLRAGVMSECLGFVYLTPTTRDSDELSVVIDGKKLALEGPVRDKGAALLVDCSAPRIVVGWIGINAGGWVLSARVASGRLETEAPHELYSPEGAVGVDLVIDPQSRVAIATPRAPNMTRGVPQLASNGLSLIVTIDGRDVVTVQSPAFLASIDRRIDLGIAP